MKREDPESSDRFAQAAQLFGVPLPEEAPTPAPEERCHRCHNDIVDWYYLLGRKTLCPACHSNIELRIKLERSTGHFSRPLIVGGLAAVIGTSAWVFVSTLLGSTLSILVILVGSLVGVGVRWGSGGRGGVHLMVLSVALTYASACYGLMPLSADATVAQWMGTLAAPVQAGIEDPSFFVILAVAFLEAAKRSRPGANLPTGPYSRTGEDLSEVATM